MSDGQEQAEQERPEKYTNPRPRPDLARDAVGHLGQALLRRIFPSAATPLEAMQTRLAQVQLAKLVNDVVVAVPIAWQQLCLAERQDWCFIGEKGSGKTATSCALGQAMARQNGVELCMVEAPKHYAEALGARTIKVDELEDLRDAVVVLDEAELRIPVGKRGRLLYQVLALARQWNLSILWTSQGLSGVHRDVLRQGVAYGFKKLDPVASRFEREEMVDVLATVHTLQERFLETAVPTGMVVFAEGRYGTVADCPLPAGWTEETSKLWR